MLESRLSSPVAILAFIATIVFANWPLSAQSSGQVEATKQVIVLLAPAGEGAPTPEEVVGAAKVQKPLPANFGVGGPATVRMLIPQVDRSKGEGRETLLGNSNHPAAVLERYLVYTYREDVDLRDVISSFSRHPHVLYVGLNRRLDLAASPNDPLFPVTTNPLTHQWGTHHIDLPETWAWAKGHAYTGIVDTGLDVDHQDLRGFYRVNGSSRWDGGNFRPHMAWDYGFDDPNVDEKETPPGRREAERAGHGTHVAGIVGATPNNSFGIAGACWYCSLVIMKASRTAIAQDGGSSFVFNGAMSEADITASMNGAVNRGVQVLNLSLGFRKGEEGYASCGLEPLAPICTALSLAASRDVVVVASAGNDGTTTLDFPAFDSRVLAAAGLEPGGTIWNDCGVGECGTNTGSKALYLPAKRVLSTFYAGLSYLIQSAECDDSYLAPSGDGLGPCTGTSMSAPYLSAAVGILRSIDPLLSKAQIQAALEAGVRRPFGWSTQDGKGIVDVDSTLYKVLGNSGSATLEGRLTPLFSLYGSSAQDFTYTTFPQVATAWMTGPGGYSPTGPTVPGYISFPGSGSTPRASVYLFSSDRSPDGRNLVPLYRLSYIGATSTNSDNRDHVYTTEAAGIIAFGDVGYELDGIEGYIYPRCSNEPSCIPLGAERLHRRYNVARDDWAIFPGSELSNMALAGYSETFGSEWIGYVYPNKDTDGDHLIDGFEALIGTNKSSFDTDCDGKSDGTEVLGYPRSDPKLGGIC